MKQQVARLSPHQNGKVFAVMTAVVSLVVFLPIFLVANAVTASDSRAPIFVVLAVPLFYLVLTYLSVALGCVFYNFMVRYTGGIEFEARSGSS